ncbi:MAG: hypothetical protein JRI46_01890 [Deltaproteobacteria bacterium]|nr:hypothetical protein [Deltaproteobacteria bacterium]
MQRRNAGLMWENAILTAIEKCGGSATLKELYQTIPTIKKVPIDKDWRKIIRAFLRRFVRIKGKLRRTGLGIYSLSDSRVIPTIYEEIKSGRSEKEILKNIPDETRHGQIEGMLIGLGNIYNFSTYTADPNELFNDKRLSALTSLDELPVFSSKEVIDVAKEIDVIWFKKRALAIAPKHTFDVEKSTDFTKALHRAYQLQDFKVSFYFVAPTFKENQFNKRINTNPYQSLKNSFFYRSFKDVIAL